MKQSILAALNKQLNLEFQAFYFYLAISTYFEDNAMPGAAAWMRHQSEEEHEHMMKIYRFILDRDAAPVFNEVAKPDIEVTSVIDAFRTSLAHEQKVSAAIHNIAKLSLKEEDMPCFQLMQWFIEEQVEEEAQFFDIIDKLTAYGEEPQFLYDLDKELGQRSADDH